MLNPTPTTDPNSTPPRRVSFPVDPIDTSITPDSSTGPLTSSPPGSPTLPPRESNATPNGARRRTTTAPNRQVTLDSTPMSQRRQTTESNRSSNRRNPSFDPNASLVRRVTTVLFTPPKKVGKAPTYLGSIKAAIMSTWLNVLLVFIPIGWALYLAKHSGGKDSISDTAVFITTFIAIIPLAGLLGFATEEAALRLGQTLGGLLNATLGNAVELIVAILALIKCELQVVQSSLVGSILSNILLVLGMCFFAGGVKFAEQAIKSTAAQLNASLLLIAVIAVLIPSAFHFSISSSTSNTDADQLAQGEGADLLAMSHGVAILLLLLYLGYLVFQMYTHAVTTTTASDSTVHSGNVTNAGGAVPATHGPSTVVPENSTVQRQHEQEEEEDDEETPQMNVVCTIGLMVLITVLVGVTAEFLVDSINGLVESHPSLSAEWVGLILLPIVGNAAEHFTAVSVSVKDKLDLSISVAVGSSIQIALFVIPVIQLLAWTIGKPMTLLFDPYESIVLFLSVLIVNQTLADGRSNWMEGLVLMMLYLIIAVSFWYYPGSSTATLLGCAESSSVVG
ncbi:calcium/proton exchanger [Kwoniella mangroviensis CBS 10435]|uniref:Calcium/proton exchanger n=1 Tax=Kwoniella mangroviensis CBS 10435 TaxID=1331196 RepID=A0A1B9IEX6_9TREE|nr:calcium/proton exchanger [Kwoniella mangroviensis CBS 10435]OCF76315.1 calcium/proton exchanger [Kwoniella mangroviensis CBS 8886]